MRAQLVAHRIAAGTNHGVIPHFSSLPQTQPISLRPTYCGWSSGSESSQEAPEEISLGKEVAAQTLERTGLGSGTNEFHGKDVTRMTKITGLILGETGCF